MDADSPPTCCTSGCRRLPVFAGHPDAITQTVCQEFIDSDRDDAVTELVPTVRERIPDYIIEDPRFLYSTDTHHALHSFIFKIYLWKLVLRMSQPP